MPARKRKAPELLGDPLTEMQQEYLLDGWSLDDADDTLMAEGPAPFASEEARRAAWVEHRAVLLALHGPGRRPWAWWRHEAPEPRRQLAAPEPLTELPKTESCFCVNGHLFCGLFNGVPNAWDCYEDFKEARFERDAAYLSRLDLWLPGERDAHCDHLLAELEAQVPAAVAAATVTSEEETE